MRSELDIAFDEEEDIVPTVEFGFDLAQFGLGDYDYGSNNYPKCHIPTTFLEVFATKDGEDEAFEAFTGFDRSHKLYMNAEEDETYGGEQTQEDLDNQARELAVMRKAHYEVCSICQRTKHTRYGKEG
jgi:hypothetical protein